MIVTEQNWHQFAPDALADQFFSAQPKQDLVSLGLAAGIGIIKLIQTGMDNGPRGRRIGELQDADKKFSVMMELMASEILKQQTQIAALEQKLNQNQKSPS